MIETIALNYVPFVTIKVHRKSADHWLFTTQEREEKREAIITGNCATALSARWAIIEVRER